MLIELVVAETAKAVTSIFGRTEGSPLVWMTLLAFPHTKYSIYNALCLFKLYNLSILKSDRSHIFQVIKLGAFSSYTTNS